MASFVVKTARKSFAKCWWRFHPSASSRVHSRFGVVCPSLGELVSFTSEFRADWNITRPMVVAVVWGGAIVFLMFLNVVNRLVQKKIEQLVSAAD